MHRYLLGIPKDPSIIVDHIDRNGLNNTRANLRITNNQTNKRNQSVCHNNKFNFNGISYEKEYNRFRACWSEYEPMNTIKGNKQKTKSFAVLKYGLEQALTLAIKTRLEKMKQFDYIIDERSETIEKLIDEGNLNIFEILGIDKESFNEVE